MERVPAEVWTMIFAYACTDSGTMGRQLSLVSRSIREASATMKLQSIAVHGPQKISSFHKLLLNTPPPLRRIRYLLLSTIPRHSGVQECELDFGFWYESNEERELHSMCQSILAAVAEYVEILYLDVWDMPNIPFPSLVELAKPGFPIFPENTWAGTDTSTVRFPQLRRWHLMNYPLSRSTNALAGIRDVAPGLIHLRISGIQGQESFVNDLRASMPEIMHNVPVARSGIFRGTGRGQHREPVPIDPKVRLPESIQYIHLKPAAYPSGARCGNPGMRYGELMWTLMRLNDTCKHVVLLPAYDTAEGYQAVRHSLSSDWEERINGGDGCWSLRDRIISVSSQ